MPSLIQDLRILIVDDSETTRHILGTIVRSREWTVCGEAENGWTGVKKFNELMPDLVLLDFAMPDINGIEVATWMSASNPTVPIIMLTILNLDGFERAVRKRRHLRRCCLPLVRRGHSIQPSPSF